MPSENDYIGLPIRSLQAMLGVIGAALDAFPSVAEDGIYGIETENAVREFQRRFDLPPTGQTDNDTWNRIVDVFTRVSPSVFPAAPLHIIWEPKHTIRFGERNRHLYLIQSMLCALGEVYADVPIPNVTGIHDAASVRAVKWFQRKCGLRDDGAITQLDWLYLTQLYRLSVGNGTSPL